MSNPTGATRGMKFDQTVENHDDLLKVVDNLLSEAGLDRKDLKGTVTFAGLDPIRETVLKVGAAGAAVGAANAIASALLHQERTGKGQDIHVDLRKAWAIHSKWQDITADCCIVNGRSRMRLSTDSAAARIFCRLATNAG